MDATTPSSRPRRRGRTALALLAVTAFAALSACGSDDGDEPAAEPTTTEATTTTTPEDVGPAVDLDGRTFVATEVTGKEKALVPDTELRLTFTDGNLSVNAGCNTQTGPYDLEDGTLAWAGDAASTMMGCDEAREAQDTWVAALFTDGVEISLDGSSLEVTGEDVTFTATEPDAGPSKLLGTRWVLTTIVTGSSAASLPAGLTPPELDLAENGTAVFDTGCNSARTTVTEADGTLTFEPAATTRKACTGDADQVERAILGVLEGEVEAVVEGGSLTLTKGDESLVYTAG